MKIFFTSDTFFGRDLKSIERGFDTVEKMNNTIIDNWNAKVSEKDIVFHLGNFAWDPVVAESSIIHLNGRIKFVGGSYDNHMRSISLVRSGRHELLPPISYLPKKGLVISHWPLLDWEAKDENSIHLHGGLIPSSLDKGFRFNISCDNWNLSPIDLDTLSDIIKTKNSTNN
jgi:calcineurin-like phosphoesterase family protein